MNTRTAETYSRTPEVIGTADGIDFALFPNAGLPSTGERAETEL
jgi:hypothetical protein